MALENVDRHDDDGSSKKDMNDSTARIATHKYQQPENEETQTYGPKHLRLLSDDRMRRSISGYTEDTY
jgi:hypothetical protein